MHLQGKWGRKAYSPGTRILKDGPCAARCVTNNSSNLLNFSCFYFSQLTGTRSASLADDEHFEIHLKQWELQREQLQSCRGWCSKGGIPPCFKGKVHDLTVGHSSRFLACPYSGCSWTHTDDWIFPMFLLSLTKSLCTTQLEKKKKSSAPTPLPVQQWEFCHLPWAESRLLLMEVEQSYSNLKQKK